MNEPGADAPDLIGTHGSADTAPADCDAAKYFTGSYGPREWNDYVGIIVGRVRFMSTKIDYVMTRRSKLGDELFFQNESAVIGGYSDSHMHTPDFLRGPLLEPAILPFRFRRRLFRRCRRTRDTAMRFRCGGLAPWSHCVDSAPAAGRTRASRLVVSRSPLLCSFV
jgi:hypothetical protein